ncbi:MAG TPA: galactokinase [bacterium]|nr:galactokinase [bacterium]
MTPWPELDHLLWTRFSTRPQFHVTAPGRINLIGEHTDYNEGFVLPAAIDRGLRLSGASSDEGTFRVWSAQFREEVLVPLDRPEDPPLPSWGRYLQAIAGELRRAGVPLRGAVAVLDGDLPAGSGLSSSAALEAAIALALLGSARATVERPDLARLAQRAESEFVGVQCGIMDQLTVLLGMRGQALLIDCRSLEVRYVSIPEHLALAICDTGVRRSLGETRYNERRRECEAAARRLGQARAGIRTLRDLTPQDLPTIDALPDPLRRRARHVLTENARVLEAVEALAQDDAATLGRALNASHRSLQEDFEVSTEELDAMVDAARGAGALGARLTGAGFGGSVLAMIERSRVDAFTSETAKGYRASTGREGTFLVCRPSDGAQFSYV